MLRVTGITHVAAFSAFIVNAHVFCCGGRTGIGLFKPGAGVTLARVARSAPGGANTTWLCVCVAAPMVRVTTVGLTALTRPAEVDAIRVCADVIWIGIHAQKAQFVVTPSIGTSVIF